ncbi:MAG: amidase family protein, partial [Planctomycetia bacterium]
MHDTGATRETIRSTGAALRAGRTTCRALVERCLDAVSRCERQVQAWVVLDADWALARADALDAALQAGGDRGLLHGIPIGVKDIIDVAGLPTAAGSKRWAELGSVDRNAPVVDRLIDAGAIVLGKTVSTPYALFDPPKTANPWRLDRTPGGSSSGS